MNNEKTQSFKIFLVFHDKLNELFYHSSLLDHYHFINVRIENDTTQYYKYKVDNLNSFVNYKPLGKWYTESEVIYNVYQNKYLTKGLNYIGFLQYDIDSTILTKELIDSQIGDYDHLAFSSYRFEDDFAQNILMDFRKPNTLTGNGRNCYFEIIDDFNRFYKSDFTIEDLKGKYLNLCSAFIVKASVFQEMMLFISFIIESNKLNNFDTQRKYRIQGGFLERYYAVWFVLKGLKTNTIHLEHLFVETNKTNFPSRFKGMVKRTIKTLFRMVETQ